MTAVTMFKPDPRENKTTIQIDKELKNQLINLAKKDKTYNDIIKDLLDNYLKDKSDIGKTLKPALKEKNKTPLQNPKNIVLVQFQRVTNTFTDRIIDLHNLPSGPNITFEISYNKPLNSSDELYEIDLKIHKIFLDNETYTPTEFFGVSQKDMVYSEGFVYYYLKALLQIISIEFKKPIQYFKLYSDYFEVARWRFYVSHFKLSPDLLSHDIEMVLSDLKSEKSVTEFLDKTANSIFNKCRVYG